jgi:hypothetical protein
MMEVNVPTVMVKVQLQKREKSWMELNLLGQKNVRNVVELEKIVAMIGVKKKEKVIVMVIPHHIRIAKFVDIGIGQNLILIEKK